jgi:AcrR family transcriptional regulator
LLAAGRSLFGSRGVTAVSAEQLVGTAGVTRGALYHHFQDKNDLFRAVYEQLEEELCTELTARLDSAGSAVEGLQLGVGWFLDVCDRNEVRQIALVDAPALLGWARWRQIESDYALGIVVDRLRAAEEEGATLTGPVEIMASLLFSMMIDAALTISTSDDPVTTRAHVEPTLQGLAARALGIF